MLDINYNLFFFFCITGYWNDSQKLYIRLNKENDIEIALWFQMNPGLESCGAAILNGGPEQFQGTNMQGKYWYEIKHVYKFVHI